ncbi:hypothetical protein LPB72_18690 [Hydrogenophaga crassostreae]|uniref:EI24 domain-containing protein n=1 Tax=Hydrogenophaga crassostreae TaxID=1763535 RepID=A0A167H2K9_9BURK|nr:EI24 domain-containing protein [Hydrogenophaga crassostreae]AOW12999.1 hypothetical protein LPB072_09195 [Hydrogenophaga crassostreae]OAD40180.1 hypothetical protein LPB72_18690 [Hydrogenophaga crassostreae]
MKQLLDSFWRAAAYCVHPRVIALSFLPLVLMVALSFGLAYFFWESAVAGMAAWLESYALIQKVLGWLEGAGLGGFSAVFAPLLVLVLATPAIVVLCLLLVALFMTPSMVAMVGRRRFPRLELKRGGSLLVSAFWSLGSTLMAGLALVVSMPLWLIPPLVLLLPPLIWGWLTYRVFAFDVLAAHASAQERKTLLRKYRGSLLLMGIVTGYMGAAPSLLWASGAMAIPLAPLLVPAAIWIYTLVFAFASLWFSHYALAALAVMRGTPEVDVLEAEAPQSGVQELPYVVAVEAPPEAVEPEATKKPPLP